MKNLQINHRVAPSISRARASWPEALPERTQCRNPPLFPGTGTATRGCPPITTAPIRIAGGKNTVKATAANWKSVWGNEYEFVMMDTQGYEPGRDAAAQFVG